MDVTLALITGFFTLGGVLVGLFLDYFKTRASLQEARRTERQKYLIWLMKELIHARAEYEQYLGAHSDGSEDADDHARIVGQGIAACLAVSDKILTNIAEGGIGEYQGKGLCPYFVPNYRSQNRDALQIAVKRLAELIADLA